MYQDSPVSQVIASAPQVSKFPLVISYFIEWDLIAI